MDNTNNTPKEVTTESTHTEVVEETETAKAPAPAVEEVKKEKVITVLPPADKKSAPAPTATPYAVIGSGDTDDVFNIQISRYRLLARAHQVRLIGLEAMQGKTIFNREDGDRANAHFRRCTQHPDGDFAAVGNQDAFDFFHDG